MWVFFFSSRRRHTRLQGDWSSDVCSSDLYYETFNMFNAAGTTYLGAQVCAYDRTKMLAGQAATQQCFSTSTTYGGLLPADLDGSRLPPSGAPNFVLALGATNTTLAYWKFHIDWTTPANTTFTGPSTITVASYAEACGGGTCIPQGGVSQQLDSLADRLMFRLAGDAAGTMPQGEGSIIDGAGSQTGSSLSRWGDYSGMSVDPSDDCTFWYTNEYIPSNGAFNWRTRIGSFKFSACGGTTTDDFSISASPSSLTLAQGAGGSSTISTAVTSGSAQAITLSVSGTPAGATASLSPTSITAGGSSTLSVNAGTAAAGTHTLVVTGTAPAAGGTLSFWYKITCPDTLTYDWATATLRDNAAGTTSTILAKVCTNNGTWVKVTTPVTGGRSYTLTLISHDDNYAGDATYTLYDDVQIDAPVSNPILNPGFETGNLSGWTSAGTTSAVTGGHSGTYAARAGSTSPTSGDSSVAQTFTAPSGSSALSFWYKVTCPDTLTYDWATASLRDNTAGTTSTVLPKVCVGAGAWTRVNASIVAGHSYTLTLISHDDNYPGDATHTLYDDLSVQ